MQSVPAVIEKSMCIPAAIASAFPHICNAPLSAISAGPVLQDRCLPYAI